MAGDFVYFEHRLEGSRIADWQWGTANAKQIIVCGDMISGNWFGGPGIGHQACLSIRNAALNRSYVMDLFKYTAGNPSIGWFPKSDPQVGAAPPGWVRTADGLWRFAFVIPGCTDGVWATDNTLGAILNITLKVAAAECTATPNTWLAGNYYGVSPFFNMIKESSVMGELQATRLGIYLDPLNTGIAPQFEIPKYEDDFTDCVRYFWKGSPPISERYSMNSYVAGGIMAWTITWPQTMRIVPTVTSDFTGMTLTNIAAPLTSAGVITENACRLHTTCTAASTNSGFLMGATNHITANARL